MTLSEEELASQTWKDKFNNLVTESDNVTQDIYRWLALISVVAGLVFQGYSVIVQGKDFDMQQFGIGIGTLFAGVGVAMKLKPESA